MPQLWLAESEPQAEWTTGVLFAINNSNQAAAGWVCTRAVLPILLQPLELPEAGQRLKREYVGIVGPDYVDCPATNEITHEPLESGPIKRQGGLQLVEGYTVESICREIPLGYRLHHVTLNALHQPPIDFSYPGPRSDFFAVGQTMCVLVGRDTQRYRAFKLPRLCVELCVAPPKRFPADVQVPLDSLSTSPFSSSTPSPLGSADVASTWLVIGVP